MSIHFSVYPFGRLVTYTVEGVPTPAEVEAFLDAVLAHRSFCREFAFLGEAAAGGAPHGAFTTSMAREVRARAKRLAPCKWAVLVASPTGHDLVVRRAERTQDSGVEVAPFRTPDEALNWLGTISVTPGRGPNRDDAPLPRPSPSGTR
jgi:hypothetical protein